MQRNAATADWLTNLSADTWQEVFSGLPLACEPLWAMDVALLADQRIVVVSSNCRPAPPARPSPPAMELMVVRNLSAAILRAAVSHQVRFLHALVKQHSALAESMNWPFVLNEMVHGVYSHALSLADAAKKRGDESLAPLGCAAAAALNALVAGPKEATEPDSSVATPSGAADSTAVPKGITDVPSS